MLLRTSQAQVWFGPQGASLSGGVTGIDFDLMKSSTSSPGVLCGTGCGCNFLLQDAQSATCNFLLPPPLVQLSVRLVIKSSDLVNAGCAGVVPIEMCSTFSQSVVRKGYCPTPALDFIGSVPFRFLYNGVSCADSSKNMFNFFGVLNIDPMGGPVSGGTEFLVNLLGYAFSKLPVYGDISCIFSTPNGTVVTLSPKRTLCSPDGCIDVPNSKFFCISPPGGVAGVGFKLSFFLGNGIWLNNTNKVFMPYDNPVLSSTGVIRVGPHAGGTVVDIYGNGFTFFPSAGSGCKTAPTFLSTAPMAAAFPRKSTSTSGVLTLSRCPSACLSTVWILSPVIWRLCTIRTPSLKAFCRAPFPLRAELCSQSAVRISFATLETSPSTPCIFSRVTLQSRILRLPAPLSSSPPRLAWVGVG